MFISRQDRTDAIVMTPMANILIVDDDIDVARLLRIYLKKMNKDVRVYYAADCQHAVEHIPSIANEHGPVDLCILDLHLGSSSGVECIPQLLTAGVKKIVILTAYTKSELIGLARSAGVSDVLFKSKGLEWVASHVLHILSSQPSN